MIRGKKGKSDIPYNFSPFFLSLVVKKVFFLGRVEKLHTQKVFLYYNETVRELGS